MKVHELDYTDNKKYKDNRGYEYIIIDGCLRDYENGEIIPITKTISEYEFEEIKIKTGWERVDNEKKYYCVADRGEIGWYIENNNCRSDEFFNNYNYFSTKEKAEEVAKEQLLYRKIKKFRDENDEYVDWMNEFEDGYCIVKHIRYRGWHITSWSEFRDLHTIYFTTEELANRCLSEIVLPFIKDNK